MNRSTGWGAAILVALAAFFGMTRRESPIPIPQQNSQQKEPASLSSSTLKKHLPGGGCSPIEARIQEFFSIPAQITFAPTYCYGTYSAPSEVPPEWQALQGKLRFLIALLPDPVHTHLALTFDQLTESIEHAAQAEQYTFDSSWLPWAGKEPEYTRYPDNVESEAAIEAREKQPGVLLFRNIDAASDAYERGLVVFVVGERPTAGINKEQFQNAVRWIAKLSANSDPNPLSILGPFSSGSFKSLEQSIEKVETPLEKLRIATGTATSLAAISNFDFDAHISPILEWKQILTFNESTELEIQRYIEFLHPNDSQIAVISEDETIFGSMLENNNRQKSAIGLVLNYPRDIASLRRAYQQQGLLSANDSRGEYASGQRLLSPDLGEKGQSTDDAIDIFSGAQANMSDESELLQIVSQLQNHKIRYVLLISSNPLDQLFLATFIRNTYPAAEIVIPSSNELFFRRRGADSLRGVLTLSPYPLNPEVQNWTMGDYETSRHIFTSDSAQGVYYATRVLLRAMDHKVRACNDSCIAHGLDLPGYGVPFWMSGGAPNRIPPTWLSVISAGRAWPVAALDASIPSEATAKCTAVSVPNNELLMSPKSLASRINLESNTGGVGKLLRSGQPPEFRIAVILCCVWAFLHGYLRWKNSVVRKPRCRAYFALPMDKDYCLRHALMLNLGWASIGAAAMALWKFSGNFVLVPSLNTTGDYQFRFLVLLVGIASATYPVCDRIANKNEYPAGWQGAVATSISLFVVVGFSLLLCLLSPGWNETTTVAQQWRAMHLLSGVSPTTPFLLLAIGGYLWSFQNSHGVALLRMDKPVLPSQEELTVDVFDTLYGRTERNTLRGENRQRRLAMFSKEKYKDAELESLPLSRVVGWPTVWIALVCVMLVAFLHLRLLDVEGGKWYGDLYAILVLVSMAIPILEVIKLCRVWRPLELLLNHLDRLPLRRTMIGLKGFSWNSVWTMGGAVLDQRYRITSRQIETFRHLKSTFESYAFEGRDRWSISVPAIRSTLDNFDHELSEFADWYSRSYDSKEQVDLRPFHTLQKAIANLSAMLFVRVLLPQWRSEQESLITSCGATSEQASPCLAMPESSFIRAAEEFVCLNYLAFAQNVIGRLRTLITGAAALFICVAASASFYPFEPRPLLSYLFFTVFAGMAITVLVVNAHMHRNATLSHITNTTPGKLEGDFYIKALEFVTGPALGLLAVIFPDLVNFLFAWIQPGQLK